MFLEETVAEEGVDMEVLSPGLFCGVCCLAWEGEEGMILGGGSSTVRICFGMEDRTVIDVKNVILIRRTDKFSENLG